jgi:riboflavin synthase
MFSGIVEAVGKVVRVALPKVEVQVPKEWKNIQVGESISVDGVCLTVVKRQDARITFDVVDETEKKTTLGNLNVGSVINLERSLQPSARIGGHFVAGHVDGVGKIYRRAKQRVQEILEIETPEGLAPYMAPKGSVAVDGVSLTLGPVGSKSFMVYLIPHTIEKTTLGAKKVGEKVNIETDILAKYVVQYLKNK